MQVVRRVGARPVALESTLLMHGVPREDALTLSREIRGIIRAEGASPALVAVVDGTPTVGVSEEELRALLAARDVPKVNSSNLGVVMHRRGHGATTISATMELAAAAGVRVFATGGLGGLHRGLSQRPDISADLTALSRFPVAVVCSGVKSLLDVEGTRELLETLGVCIVGFGTDRFPAFYLRESDAMVDARFDDIAGLGEFVRGELARSGRGIVIANPIPAEHAIPRQAWDEWLARAQEGVPTGRDATPFVLARLHELSAGATLRANIALIKANAALAARLAVMLDE